MGLIKNKTKIVILTSIITILLFSVIVFLEKKVINFKPQVEVAICLTGVEKGKELNKKNFILEKRSILEIPKGAVKSLDEIKGIAAVDIYQNEILNNNRITTADNNNYFSSPNIRRFSIPMTYIDNPIFAGTLRPGDKIDIIHTELPSPSNPSPITKTEVQKANVIRAYNSEGKLLTKDDPTLATEIILEGEPEEIALLANGQYTGKYKYVQVSPDAERYVPVTVTNETQGGN